MDRPRGVIAGDPLGDHAIIDPADGRMTELVLGGRSLLVPREGRDAMWWGAFVMAPWTSLLREPVDADGRRFEPPAGDAAWHGVGRTASWLPAGSGALEAELAQPWPFGGRIRQEVSVGTGGLVLRLSVSAGVAGMPAALGWHPWFRREVDGAAAVLRVADGTLVQERDDTGVPTGRFLTADARGPDDWNDGVRASSAGIEYHGAGTLRLIWDAPFAILFSTHEQGVCVEPATAPAESAGEPLRPGAALALTVRARWVPA